jgi:hypothetical protein
MERLGHNSERKRAEPPPSREEREMSDEVESEAGRTREPGSQGAIESHWEPLASNNGTQRYDCFDAAVHTLYMYLHASCRDTSETEKYIEDHDSNYSLYPFLD